MGVPASWSECAPDLYPSDMSRRNGGFAPCHTPARLSALRHLRRNFPATTAQTLDSFDRAFRPAAHQSRARVMARGLVPSQLRRFGGGSGVIALALFLIAAMSALVLMFLVKLRTRSCRIRGGVQNTRSSERAGQWRPPTPSISGSRIRPPRNAATRALVAA